MRYRKLEKVVQLGPLRHSCVEGQAKDTLTNAGWTSTCTSGVYLKEKKEGYTFMYLFMPDNTD